MVWFRAKSQAYKEMLRLLWGKGMGKRIEIVGARVMIQQVGCLPFIRPHWIRSLAFHRVP